MSLRHMRTALLLALVALAACSTEQPPPVTPGPGPLPVLTPTPAGHAPGLIVTPPGSAPAPACRLPAPVKSDDACSSDADCGPSEPCHAHACVAKAKAKPRTPDTMCTMKLDCASVDVNRCGCFEGRCALIPPSN